MLNLSKYKWTYADPAETLEKALWWKRKDGTIWTHQDPHKPDTKIVPYDANKHRGRKEVNLAERAKKFGLSEDHVEQALNATPSELDFVLQNMTGDSPQIRLPEDADKVKKVFAQLHQARNKKIPGTDLMQLKTFHNLREKMEDVFGKDAPVEEKQDWKAALQDEKPVFSNKEDGIQVYQFDESKSDKLSAVGKGTGWCVQNPATAKDYLGRGKANLITVGGKRLLLEHAESDQLKNVLDVEIKYITPEIAEALKESGSTIERRVMTKSQVVSENDPSMAREFAALSTKRDPALEGIIKDDGGESVRYAFDRGVGFRFEAGEPAIASNQFTAVAYKAHLGIANEDELNSFIARNNNEIGNIYWKKYPQDVADRVQIEAVEHDPHVIRHIPDKVSEKVQMAAVRRNGSVLEYIADRASEEVKMEAVKNDGFAIKPIADSATEAMQLAAVRQNGNAIAYIKDKASDAVKVAAVLSNPRALSNFKQDPDEFERIRNLVVDYRDKMQAVA